MGSTNSPRATTLDSSALALCTRSSSQTASRPRPIVNTISASATLATSRAPGWNECGSPPGGSRPKTSTPSPPTIRAQSATKLVVVTTWMGGPEGVALSMAAVVSSVVCVSWVVVCVSWSSAQAASKTPNITRATVSARARRPKPPLRFTIANTSILPSK